MTMAVSHLTEALQPLPPFAQVALLKSLHNAWATSRRFNRQALSCPWCGIHGGDDLSHLLRCTAMLHWMRLWHPRLHAEWVEYRHPPLVPHLCLGAFAMGDCVLVRQSAVLWHDFLSFAFNAAHNNPGNLCWIAAWQARARVWHRFGIDYAKFDFSLSGHWT